MSIDEAEKFKQKANDFVSQKKYEEAVKEYNKSISLAEQAGDDPEILSKKQIYYSNRSAAFANMCKYDSALSDAEKCLSIDSKFVKGYSRKGLALFKMGRTHEAMNAYRQGLIVDPTNVNLKEAIASMNVQARSGGVGSGMFGSIIPGVGSIIPGVDTVVNGITNAMKGSPFEGYLAKLAQNKVMTKIVFYGIAIAFYFGISSGIKSLWGGSGSSDSSKDVNPAVSDANLPKDSNGNVIPQVEHRAFSVAGKGGIHYLKRNKYEIAVGKAAKGINMEENISDIPSTRRASDDEFESDIGSTMNNVEETVTQTDPSNVLTTRATSLLFLHAPVFSAEGARNSFESFKSMNVLAMDLPCHGRSTCWTPITNEDYENSFSTLISKEKDFLGPNRVLVLSGYSPWLTKAVMDAINPFLVVWTKPNFHLLDNTNGEGASISSDQLNLKPPTTLNELRDLLGPQSADNIPLKQLRDMLEHLTHERITEREKVDVHITKGIFDDVISPIAPVMVFNDEEQEDSEQSSSTRYYIRMDDGFNSEEWASRVKEFLNKWSGSSEESGSGADL